MARRAVQHAMQAENIWLVDPLDGTKSFVRDTPFFSTQIALMRGVSWCWGFRRPACMANWPGPSGAAARG